MLFSPDHKNVNTAVVKIKTMPLVFTKYDSHDVLRTIHYNDTIQQEKFSNNGKKGEC